MEPCSLIAPPRAAVWLLERALAPADRDALIGDLHEEYVIHVAPARGVRAARWWYRWQVARSLAPLLRRSWERASLGRAAWAVVGAALAATMPASALLMVRSFVLQQVPLKTTADLSVAFAAVLGLVVLAAGLSGLIAAMRVLTTDPRQR